MADILYSYHEHNNNLCAIVVILVGATFDTFAIFKVRQSRKDNPEKVTSYEELSDFLFYIIIHSFVVPLKFYRIIYNRYTGVHYLLNLIFLPCKTLRMKSSF